MGHSTMRTVFVLLAAALVATPLGSGCGGGAAPVPPPRPTVGLAADDATIVEGESTTLRWTSTNAASVVSSNFGATTVSGSKSVSPTATTTYTITVKGPGGQSSNSVQVKVTPQPDSGDVPFIID